MVTGDAKPAPGSSSSIPRLCLLVRLLVFMQLAQTTTCKVMVGGRQAFDFGRSRYVGRDGAKSKVKGFPCTIELPRQLKDAATRCCSLKKGDTYVRGKHSGLEGKCG